MEFHENPCDTAGVRFVHREPLAGPIARATQAFELFDDDATVFVLPFPDFFKEPVPSQIIPVTDHALLLQ